MSQTKTPSRRHVLKTSAAAISLLAAPALVRAQGGPKIRVGYWPIAAGLPFYAAVELGYFKEAGVNVEVIRLAGAQQIMEGMLADRIDGCANGTGSGNIAVGELAAPGSFKIFCSNPSNACQQPGQNHCRPERQKSGLRPRHSKRHAG
jgi:NitT/TauT family transport system substrate-binding protein